MSDKQQVLALLHRNEPREARKLCAAVCARDPTDAEAWFLLGGICGQLGDYKEAESCCRRVLAMAPGMAVVHYNLGVALLNQGRTKEAVGSFEEALKLKPDFAEAHHDLANALQLENRIDAAEASYATAIAIRPSFAEAHNNLGRLLQGQGKLPAAIHCFRHAVASRPDNAVLHFNLGNALWEHRLFEEALGSYRMAIRINAGFTEAHRNLASVLLALGRRDEAFLTYQAAVRGNPDSADLHMALADFFYTGGRLDEAVRECEAVLRLDSGAVQAYRRLAGICYERGEAALAAEYYGRLAGFPHEDGARIQLATILPLIVPDKKAVDTLRDSQSRSMDALLDEDLQVADPVRELAYTNFFLAYHGRNDRELQTKLARLYLRACPSLTYTAAHCRQPEQRIRRAKIRVGFLSRFFRNHSIGRTSKGLIALFSRDLFEVFVIFLDAPRDETGQFIERHADRSIVLPADLATARERIAEQELDILFYQDIGMDSFTSLLAMARLAPVQCASFGHPVTSGIPTIDYYISTEDWEPPDADQHYSEKLIRLRNVASVAYYYKPEVPASLKGRSYFGLNEEDHIYLCPQTLFKFHPDLDDVLSGILRADPRAVIVLIEGVHKPWGEQLRTRFRATIPDQWERILFLPQQRGGDFINLIAVADVMLDTVHFCGFNTTLEAFAVGTPVVTLPGRFMRGRHTASFYKRLGIADCVAHTSEEYIDIAVRFGTDPDYRSQIGSRILAASDAIWEDITVVREFERCFSELFPGGGG